MSSNNSNNNTRVEAIATTNEIAQILKDQDLTNTHNLAPIRDTEGKK